MKKYNIASNKKRIYAFFIDCFLTFKWLLLVLAIFALINFMHYIMDYYYSDSEIIYNYLHFQQTPFHTETKITKIGEYASYVERLDYGMIFLMIFNIILLLFLLFSLIWIFVIFIKQIIQITKTGQTLGKKKMKVQIIDLRTNKPIKCGKYFLSRPLTVIIIGLFGIINPIVSGLLILINGSFIFFDKNHDALHDKFFKTRVIDLS